MKSRLADSTRRSFPYRNPGRCILAFTLLAASVTGAAAAQGTPAVSPSAARTGIQAGYAEWAKARVTLDMNTIERMLAPDFYFQTSDRKYTRQEFIDRAPTLKITRFDETVLTVEPRGNDWSVVIFAKAEVETKDKEGKTSKGYIALVARDGWRKLNDHQWVLLSSEPLGRQQWQERPPIANW